MSEHPPDEAAMGDLARRLVGGMGAFMFELAPDGMTLWVTPAVGTTTGHAPDELVGTKLWDVLLKGDQRRQLEGLKQRLGSSDLVRDPLEITAKDGSAIRLELTTASRRGVGGELIGILGMACDVTDRDRAVEARLEHERRRHEEALRETEEQVRLLLDSTAAGVCGLDLGETFTFINSAALRLLGHGEPGPLIGRGMHEIVHHTRADGSPNPAEECRIRRAIAGGEALHLADETFWRADGTSFPSECWVRPIRWGEDVQGYVVTFLDITERKVIEERLRRSQRLDALGQLAGGVAHDFANLLMLIQGHTSLLLDAAGTYQGMREGLQSIREAADRGSSLTHQILAFSRREGQKPRSIDLCGVVQSMGSMLARILGSDVVLDKQLAEGPVWVRADRGQLDQVLLNLAVNSRDAMPQGGRLTIATSIVQLAPGHFVDRLELAPGRYVLLAVTDTGYGMDERTKARIFEPFFTTKGEGTRTGIGLSTVQDIVRRADGHVTVESSPGAGTTFRIYLPEAPEDEREVVPTAETLPLTGGTETILVVDDSDSIRHLVRAMLELRGYTVVEASNGPEAAKRARTYRGPIHLLLVDVIMPGSSGPDTADRLRADLPGLKVLFMSAYADRAILRHRVLERGEPFIPKPFTTEEILAKVREVLGPPTEAVPRA